MNRSGNTIVTVLVVSTLILGGVVISMQYVGLTNTSSINALKNSLAGADDLTALNILSGKLTMTKEGSEWGVEPYPIGSELALSTFKPYIKNFSTLAQGTKSYVPNLRAEGQKTPSGDCRTLAAPTDRLNSVFLNEECRRTNFDLDASLLGSLERGGDIGGWSEALSTRNQTELQKGFVGYPKPSQLIEGDFKNFLNGTTATFPPDGIKAKAVTFYKLGFDKNEPRILSSLEVAVGDTRAIIPFPAPPDPTCKITTQIDPRFIDCHNEPVVTYIWQPVGSHSVSTPNTATVATSTPRTSVSICRCSNTSAPYQPLEPRVDGCSGFTFNRGCNTFSASNTIYHINLGPRPGFSYRGRIYATNPYGEQLGADEIAGMSQISFATLLSEMGVSATIAGTSQVTTYTNSTVIDYGNVPHYSTKQVCETRQTPQCNGNCIELSSGRGVTTRLFADSIVGSFKLSADSFLTGFPTPSDRVADSSRQSIQTIRKFSDNFPQEVPGREPVYQMLLKPPANLYILQGARIWQGNDDEHGTWTVQGQVAGLQKAPNTVTCPTDFQVYPPPPPHCVASVANPRILKGESTEVTLNCNLPGSGRVTEARFMNGNSFPVGSFPPGQRGAANYKVARASYTRTTDYQTETINITVTGWGGSINVSTELGAVCPHNDPNYVSYIQKEVFAQSPLRRAEGQIGEWWVSEASNVWNPTNYGLTTTERWDPRIDTADSVNHFNMASIQIQSTPYDPKDPKVYKVIEGLWINTKGVMYWVAYGPKRDPNCAITQYALRRQGCFTSDTRIRMADGREKLVSEVSENDLIWNPLYQSPVKVTKVVKGPEKKALYQLRVGKNKLVVTEDHPFLTQRGWVRADELDTKDLIMGEGLGKQILSVKKLSYKKPVDVFNFELDTDIAEGHMVIANGIPTGDLTTQLAIKQNRKNLP